MYVEKVKIIGNSYPGSKALKLNSEFQFSNINLLVGDQGCGKSTLLTLMQKNHKDIELTLSKQTIEKGIKTFYFDTEKDNPRLKDIAHYSNPNGTSKGIGVGGALMSYFKSHGEVLKEFTIKPLLKAKDCVIFLDEPESGLSLTNQFKLIDAILRAESNNCQLFIATHCFPLIENFDVISLEHTKQMKGIDFIKLIKQNLNDSNNFKD